MPLDLRSRERHPLYRAAAVPEGSVRAPSQVLYRAACRIAPELAGLRSDALATVLALTDALADHADWATMVSRPTHAELARRAGCSTRTVRRYRALIETAGLVGIVTPGRTSDPVDPDAGPLAQAYVLTIPVALLEQLQPSPPAGPQLHEDEAAAACIPVDELGHPSQPTFGGLGDEPPHAREARPGARCARGDRNENRPDQEGLDRGSGSFWPITVRPVTRAERQLAAAEARRIDPVLRRVSVAHVAALCRELHLKGWTVADVRHALVHRPDGTPWPHSLVVADVRHVPGWFRHRIAAWRTDPTDPASPPAWSRSQHAAAAHVAAAAAHAEQVATDRATAAAAVPAAAVDGWATARAAQTTRAAAAAAAVAHARRHPPTTPAPTPAPVAQIDPGPRTAGGPATGRVGLRPAAASADPRVAALRAAVRAGRRPRA